jgi:DNA polymerase-3 subunit gamma/tau
MTFMTYTVLARKYRPKSFEEMVGQEHVVQALVNALQRQRLHHAYLFTGTRGIGKTTVSRILAKSLNCTGPDGNGGITARPCGQCTACREIDADRYIDYVELDAASNRGIDEIRDLLERAAYKPSVGRFKVFMIDEAHQLTKESFNALLKTLEEPPDYLKFVLATTDPEKMLPTVLSRCLQFNLRPMPPEVVREHLQRVMQAEGVACDAGSLRLLSRAARGSMRDALSLTDQAIAYGGGSVDEGVVRQMLGAVDRSYAAQLVQALAAGDGRAVLETVQVLRDHGLSAAGTLDEMAQLLQQMAVLQAVPDALDAGDPDAATAARLSSQLPADETQLLYCISLHGREELHLAPDEYSGLVMVLLRLLAFKPQGPGQARGEAGPASSSRGAREAVSLGAPRAVAQPVPASTGRAPGSLSASVAAPALGPDSVAASNDDLPPWLDAPVADDEGEGAPLPAPPDVPAAVRQVAAFAPTALGERWAGIVNKLVEQRAISALARELAMQAECVGIGDGEVTWRLRVERESLRGPAHMGKLQTALASLLGHPLRIEIEAGDTGDTPARRGAAERERRQREAEQIIHDDPLVQQMLAQFKTARIVPGSVKPH